MQTKATADCTLLGAFYMPNTNSESIRDHKYGTIWREVFARDNSCVLCKSNNDLCIDHILSVKDGGKSTLENMRVLCRSCNSKNSSRALDPKRVAVREYMKQWRVEHPSYFKIKSKEFVSRNPGYYTKSSEMYRHLYKQSHA